MRIAVILQAAILAALLGGCRGDSDPTSTSTPTIAPSPTAAPTPVPTVEPVTTLLFTGDIIPARCVHTEVMARGGDWRLPFEALHDQLSAADITIGTLDSTISDTVVPTGCIATFSLGSVADVANGLQYAGYDVMSHAANHIKDGGEQALLDTIANLKAAGIQPTGSGADLYEARAPAVVVRNGVSFAFLGYDDIAPYYWATDTTAGAAPIDAATIAADIMNARKYAHVVVILPQWGVEYTSVPSERQREFARAAIAAGADLVVGNHPHWVQGYETIDGPFANGVFVAYALGNFVFDQDWSAETQQGAMLQVTFTGTRVTGTRYIPIRIHDRYQPRLAEGEEAASILQRIEDAAATLTTGQ